MYIVLYPRTSHKGSQGRRVGDPNPRDFLGCPSLNQLCVPTAYVSIIISMQDSGALAGPHGSDMPSREGISPLLQMKSVQSSVITSPRLSGLVAKLGASCETLRTRRDEPISVNIFDAERRLQPCSVSSSNDLTQKDSSWKHGDWLGRGSSR